MTIYKRKIGIFSNIDISRFSGDTGRVMAFANELRSSGMDVSLIVPPPKGIERMVPSDGINIIYLPLTHNKNPMLSTFYRTYEHMKLAKQMQNDDIIFLIETSTLGGYLAVAGLTNYVLDIHGIAFDEINYADFPWYIPKKIFSKYIYYLERLAAKNSKIIIAVSESMAEFISNDWNIDRSKIIVIPNGYFDSQVAEIQDRGIKQIKGSVTFVGLLSKWANIEKIIEVANVLRNEPIMFYIVGGGPNSYYEYIKKLINTYNLKNVTLFGSIPLVEAYNVIASSEVMLLPFKKTLCTEVAHPIKVLEYMAFGKSMVLDEISDISRFLKKENAALVCDPEDTNEFAENIKILLNDDILRQELGTNAKALSKGFSWKVQGQRLAKIIVEHYEVSPSA